MLDTCEDKGAEPLESWLETGEFDINDGIDLGSLGPYPEIDEGELDFPASAEPDALGEVIEVVEVSDEIRAFEATMDGINPGYDPFSDDPRSTNCGACAWALEERLSGRDPEAVAGVKNIGTAAEMSRMTGMEQQPAHPTEIEAHARAMGPGYHAIVGFDRMGSADGHWFNVAVSGGGRVYALDPQCGIAMPFGEYITSWAADGVNFDVSLSCEEGLHGQTE